MGLSGTDFEKLVKPFFEQILKELSYTGIVVRNQNSGTQDGFDIHASFVDTKGNNRDVFIECKYYTTTLDWSEAFKKQVELHAAYKKIDGLILISPKQDLSNVDHRIQANASIACFKFPCQFWTPNSQIKEILALDSEMYKKVYGSDYSGTINRDDQLKHLKGLLDKLFNEKDHPSGIAPVKEQYPAPTIYIPRKTTRDTEKWNTFYDRGETLEFEFKKENKIALIGWAGTGKSTELEYLAYKLSENDSLYYPFFRKLNIHTDKEIKDYIPDIDNIPSNLIVLLLDGLDEVQSGSFDTVSRKIQQFCSDYKEARVIVSCRANFYSTVLENSKHNTLRGFRSLYLSDLSYKGINDYLTTKLGNKKAAFEEEVDTKKLTSLLNVPYYLIKLTEQYLKHNRVSDSKAALFEEIITENIEEDVDRYYRETKLPSSKKMRSVLEKLAFLLEYQGKNYCTWEEIVKAFDIEEQNFLKSAGNLVYGSDQANSIWKFNHNNTQEYLVAKILSKLNFREIREIITFKPENTKIKPTWVNTLSFLITILEKNSLSRELLLKMLEKNEPELVVKFEPDKLDESTRLRIFKEIFLDYKKKGRWINRNKYNYQELARFSMNQPTLDFLLEQCGRSEPTRSIITALDLISYYNLKRDFSDSIDKVKKAVEYHLFNSTFEDQYVIVRSYLDLFMLSIDEFNKVMDKYSKIKNTWVRYTLYYGIHSQGFQDKYIDYIIERIKKSIKKEDTDEDRLSNEDSELKECISKLKTKEAIEKALDFIVTDYGNISYSSYYKGVIERVLSCIEEHHINNQELLNKVADVYSLDAVSVHGEDVERFLKLFDKAGKRLDVFKKIYENEKANLKFYTLYKLAILANEDSLEFLANEFQTGQITKENVEAFQYQLGRDNPLLSKFNTLVNQTQAISLPAYRDMEKARKNREAETLLLLFDKEKFKAAIEQIFVDAGKDELNYEEMLEIHKTEWEGKYLQIVYDCTRIYDEGKVKKRTAILEWIDKNWVDYSKGKLYSFLKNHPEIELNNEQRKDVENWCTEKLKNFNFKTALVHPTPHSTTADRLAVWTSFFMRKFKFKNYDSSIYLDMLSFIKWEDKETEIFDFVEACIDKNLMDERVIQNISGGINYYMILESHMNYCVKSHINQITPNLIQYLKVKESQRYHVLDCFLQLKGDLNLLIDLLPGIKDEFRFELIKKLLHNGQAQIEPYVIDSFKKEPDSNNKLQFANYLIQLQNILGIDYYLEYIRKNKKTPGFLHYHSPFDKLTSIKTLPKLFELFEFGFDPEIEHDKFENLETAGRVAIESVSLSENNFKHSVLRFKLFKSWFKFSKLLKLHSKAEKIIIHLEHYYEEIERKYYINKSSMVTLDEAIRKYKTIRA